MTQRLGRLRLRGLRLSLRGERPLVHMQPGCRAAGRFHDAARPRCPGVTAWSSGRSQSQSHTDFSWTRLKSVSLSHSRRADAGNVRDLRFRL